MDTYLIIHGQSFIENELDQLVEVPTHSINKRLGYGLVGFSDQIWIQRFIFLDVTVFFTFNYDICLIILDIAGWQCSHI